MAYEGSMPFVKNLAASGKFHHSNNGPNFAPHSRRMTDPFLLPPDSKIRTSALASLESFLFAHADALTPIDVLKIWKGLFYALWMCDRPIPQQNLCRDLASLVLSRYEDVDVVHAWLRGFWAIMAREWHGIDVYRIDKFLLLMRRLLCASFCWMKMLHEPPKIKKSWKNARKGANKIPPTGKEEASDANPTNPQSPTSKLHPLRTATVLSLLAEWPLSPDDEFLGTTPRDRMADLGPLAPDTIPVGLRIHVLDIWVDEAERAGLLNPHHKTTLLQPVADLIDALETQTTSPAVKIRAKDSLVDERLLTALKPTGGGGETDEGEEGNEDDERRKGIGAEGSGVGSRNDKESWDGFDD